MDGKVKGWMGGWIVQGYSSVRTAYSTGLRGAGRRAARVRVSGVRKAVNAKTVKCNL